MAAPGAEIAAALRERRGEIERATLARLHGIADPAEVGDAAYAQGLGAAVAAGIDYALGSLESSPAAGPLPGPVPVALLDQARHAAYAGVPLETVLRRYFAAHALLADFTAQAAQQRQIPTAKLRGALRRSAALADRLAAAAAAEHARALHARRRDPAQRRSEQVRMLLAGELLERTELGYELGGWHLGVLTQGPGAREALRELARSLDRRPLIVGAQRGTAWGWLGGGRRPCARRALAAAAELSAPELCLAIGEPGEGLDGWRLTHRQAKAALGVARLGPPRQVAYSQVALLASALGDEVLAAALREAYLRPLESGAEDGAVLRQTLEAYFDSGGNASSAAAALGLSRNTVGIRLRAVEERIGRPVEECAAELSTALRLHVLGISPGSGNSHLPV